MYFGQIRTKVIDNTTYSSSIYNPKIQNFNWCIFKKTITIEKLFTYNITDVYRPLISTFNFSMMKFFIFDRLTPTIQCRIH